MRWRRGNRLKLVGEAEAAPRTREILDEVRHSLGLPIAPLLYQAYAAYPEFLEIHWQAFRPAVQSRQFFLCGARLAAESYTRVHNYFDVDSLAARELHSNQGPGLSLAQVLDYYQYADPLLLLIATAQLQAFEGAVGSDQSAPERPQHPSFPSFAAFTRRQCRQSGAAAHLERTPPDDGLGLHIGRTSRHGLLACLLRWVLAGAAGVDAVAAIHGLPTAYRRKRIGAGA